MVVTNRRIVFLDDSKPPELFSQTVIFKRHPFYDKYGNKIDRPGVPPPHSADWQDLSPFWTLVPLANDQLDQELKKNPKAYSKAPMAAWWIQGYRVWNWIGSPVKLHQDPSDPTRWVIEVPKMVLIRAFAGGGAPGRHIPRDHEEGRAELILKSLKDAQDLQDLVDRMNKFIPVEPASPFTQDYITNYPVKPMSGPYLAYYYVFWIGLAAAIMIGVLWGLGAPFWITVPLILGGCLSVVYFLRQKHLRAEISIKEKRQPQGDPKRLVRRILACLGLFFVFLSAVVVKHWQSVSVHELSVNASKSSVLQPHPLNQTIVGGVWLGFENAPIKDRENELRSQIGGQFRRVTADGNFNDLCRSIGGQCIQVRDWQGWNFTCDTVSNVRHDGSRLALCKLP